MSEALFPHSGKLAPLRRRPPRESTGIPGCCRRPWPKTTRTGDEVLPQDAECGGVKGSPALRIRRPLPGLLLDRRASALSRAGDLLAQALSTRPPTPRSYGRDGEPRSPPSRSRSGRPTAPTARRGRLRARNRPRKRRPLARDHQRRSRRIRADRHGLPHAPAVVPAHPIPTRGAVNAPLAQMVASARESTPSRQPLPRASQPGCSASICRRSASASTSCAPRM